MCGILSHKALTFAFLEYLKNMKILISVQYSNTKENKRRGHQKRYFHILEYENETGGPHYSLSPPLLFAMASGACSLQAVNLRLLAPRQR